MRHDVTNENYSSFDVNGKQARRKYPTSIKINRFYTFMMHCDAINILCARSSDNKTASCRIARKDSSSLSKISPFPRAHKLAAYNIGFLRLGGRHQKDVRTRSETENFHGHGSDLVTRSMCIRSSNRGKNGTSGKEEQPRAVL